MIGGSWSGNWLPYCFGGGGGGAGGGYGSSSPTGAYNASGGSWSNSGGGGHISSGQSWKTHIVYNQSSSYDSGTSVWYDTAAGFASHPDRGSSGNPGLGMGNSAGQAGQHGKIILYYGINPPTP